MRTFSLTFVTNAGCHLCQEAAAALERVASRYGVQVDEVDMSSDDELVRRYSLRIPVVLSPDGEVLAEGVVDERRLARAVRRALRRGRPRRRSRPTER